MTSGTANKRPTSEPSRELLRRASRGDHRAFRDLVRKYEKVVYAFSFKICRDRLYAEETLQDTFVSVFQNLKQFDGRSKFSTWLYSIVANNCLMKRRRNKLEQNSVSIHEPSPPHTDGDGQDDAPEIPAWQRTPLDETVRSEIRARLDRAIQMLPLDYRMVFILRDLEGKSAGETAKIMHLSIAATKSRLRRARVFLREQLNDYMTS